jgi:hypothetical protein
MRNCCIEGDIKLLASAVGVQLIDNLDNAAQRINTSQGSVNRGYSTLMPGFTSHSGIMPNAV